MAAPSLGEISSALLYPNSYWSGPTITYSFPGASSAWPGYASDDEQSYPQYAGLNATGQAQFAETMALWDRLIAPRIVVTDDLTATGQIRIAFTDVDDYTDDKVNGFAYEPPIGGGAGQPWSGDIWLDYEFATDAFTSGGQTYRTLLHEGGHALGLKHPFGSGPVLPTEFDNGRYSVMSYTHTTDIYFFSIEDRSDGVYVVGKPVFPSTPMVFDIAAIQSRYGADPTTATGNDTYTWSQSKPLLEAIYDAGGIDTINLAAHTRPSNIDLTPGAYSSIAYFTVAQQKAAILQQFTPNSPSAFEALFAKGDTYIWSNNLGIAYSTIIENVIAGSGNDTVIGNLVTNVIDGGAGDDYLRGMEGDDSLAGGSGFDDINGNMGNDTAVGGLGPDWVVGGKDNDLLSGEDGNDIVYGNLGDDWCDGGAGDDIVRGGQEQDVLQGQAGADWMSGDRGADTITGGAGADIFHTFGDAGLDLVTDFSLAQGDRVMLDPGTTYSVSQQGADTVIDMGGGGRMVLAGVALSTLTGDWIFGA